MLNNLKQRIQSLNSDISKLDKEYNEISLLYKKRKDEVTNLLAGQEKYKKDNPKIAGQMEALIKAKSQDFEKVKKDMVSLQNKQRAVREEIKKLFGEINGFVRAKKNTQTILSKVTENSKNISKLIEENRSVAAKPALAREEIKAPVAKAAPVINEEIKPAIVTPQPVEEKKAINEEKPETIIAKAPVKKPKADDFHSKAAKESEDQAKYLKSISSKSRNYGNA